MFGILNKQSEIIKHPGQCLQFEIEGSLWLWLNLFLNSSSRKHLSLFLSLFPQRPSLSQANQQSLWQQKTASRTCLMITWSGSLRLKITFSLNLCFSSWVLRLSTFPWDRTEGPWNRSQSWPQNLRKWFITLTSLLTNQQPAGPQPPNPRVLWFCPI